MELKIERENVIVPIVSALLIVIISNLKIDWYFKTIMFPFFMILVSSTILVMKNDDINKKAFYLLIPIILIIFSNLILILLKGTLDENNEILNIIVLPILISIYLFSLINKNYKIALVNIPLMFKIFPRYLFRNLKFLKIKTSREKTNKILNAVFGIIVGIVFSIVILLLLMSADDYFNKFVSKAFISINFDFSKIMQFVIFFIIIFSIGVNLIRNRYIVMKENKIRKIDHTIIISMLSVINLVFVLFLISEISKLCGNFLQIPKGYIYSSYAREGFFQLLFVTIINFSIILYLIYKTNVIKENKVIRNLVIAATGVGKTVLAAFDFKNFLEKHPNAKFLYVVHRQEILKKSCETFRQILKDANFGELYVGNYKPNNIDRLFTTPLGLENIMKQGDSNYYDYIVADEIHHGAAKTYDNFLTYFNPKLLLGLTATLERMDGKDITKYFCNTIAAEMRLPEAINNKLLVPFQYYGITDPTDLSNVRWSSFGYNNSDLDKVFVEDEYSANVRVTTIIDNLFKYIDDLDKVHGLGFCSSINHAKYVADKFNENNIPSICLTGSSDSNLRNTAIKDLESGKIKFIFTVDLYNEGVDIPCVNVELLLRPTDSLTIFLQQLGRGLRKHSSKDYLIVLDFIGECNKHFNYADKFKALIGMEGISVKEAISNGFPILPVGCSIALERVAEEYILSNIKANTNNRQVIIEMLQKFEETTYKKLSLYNFVNHYKLNINDIYKKDVSFYRLLTEAGIKNFRENNSIENAIVGRLKNLLTINSPKFIYYIKSILNDDSAIHNELLDRMTYYTLFNKLPEKEGFNNIIEALEFVKNSECLNYEINEICNYLYNSLEVLPINHDLNFECPLEVYGIYSQAQLYSGLGVFTEKYAGPMLQGVWYLKENNHDIFLVTINKESSHFGESIAYEDYAINDELFHWQTQNSVADGSDTLNRYINSNGRISLFVRINRKENGQASPYIYLGEAEYVSHSGSRPVGIVWKLKHKIPAKYLDKMMKI